MNYHYFYVGKLETFGVFLTSKQIDKKKVRTSKNNVAQPVEPFFSRTEGCPDYGQNYGIMPMIIWRP